MNRLRGRFAEFISRFWFDDQGIRQFRRYFIVGLSNAGLSYVLLILLYDLQTPHAGRAAVAQAGACAVVMSWSYFWNRRWSFNSANPMGREGARFLVGQALIFGLAVGSMGLLVDVLEFPLTLSWIAMNGLVVVTNFSLLKLWVFSKSR